MFPPARHPLAIALLVAGAFSMENLDGTVIALNWLIVEEKSQRTMTWMMSLQGGATGFRMKASCTPFHLLARVPC
jgi:hypothetical protein